jgi:deoxyribodipyrimidine photo-lyase
MADVFQAPLSGVTRVTARESAVAKIDAINLAQYERTRNALNGRVSRLSPYLTHGVTNVPEIITRLARRTNIGWQDKFIFELGWREYFHHVWRVLGDEIWQAQRPPPALDATYAEVMPEDVLTACTGVAIIDDQVRELYRSGYLHNHARMWLASYLVHIRKVDWRVGARWMYTYLLDGDLASNTLSWQWVAGTWTGKPYLFNADNVEKYAPGFLHEGTAIDTTYEALDYIARTNAEVMESPQRRAQEKLDRPPIAPPAIFDAACIAQLAAEVGLRVVDACPAGASVELLHPWSLRRTLQPPGQTFGMIVPAFHAQYPWSKQRWQFVLEAMREACDGVWVVADALPRALSGCSVVETLNPYYASLIVDLGAYGATIHAPPRAFIDPERLQRSFSSFWHRANKEKFPL